MEQGFVLKTAQEQKLSQHQIMALNLLAMDSMELERYMQEEFCSNPLLEERERAADFPAAPNNHTGKQRRQWDGIFLHEDIPTEAFSPIEELVLEQLSGPPFLPDEQIAARRMAHCLDDDGYYRLSEPETAALTGLPAEKNAEILRKLKTLSPSGLFAADYSECILLQIEQSGKDPNLFRSILQCDLNAIAKGKINLIAQRTGISKTDVRNRLDIIRSLSPKPLSSLNQTQPISVIPDVLFLLEGNEITPILNDHWTADYGLSDYYCQIMDQEDNADLKAYFRSKHDRAVALIAGIEQRRQTILNICDYIIRFQKAYILGQASLTPMSMTDIANELAVHPSTVSRALKGKVFQLPRGCVSAKSFFTAGLDNADSAVSVGSDRVRRWIRDTIAKEDGFSPYSDQALAELLQKEGVKVSRRVIAKYREEMLIPSSYLRKH